MVPGLFKLLDDVLKEMRATREDARAARVAAEAALKRVNELAPPPITPTPRA